MLKGWTTSGPKTLLNQIRCETDKWRDILKRVLDVILLLSRQNFPIEATERTLTETTKATFLM